MSHGFFLTRERRAELPGLCVRAWARVGHWLSGRMQAQYWSAAGSRSSRPLIGNTPVPQSAPQPVSYILLYHPGRGDFPDPVGSEEISSWSLPVARAVQAMVRIRCPHLGLLHASSGWLATDTPDSEFRSGLPHQTAFAQGSFTPEVYPPSLLLRAHAQIPVPLIFISCSALIEDALAACTTNGWSSGPSRFGLSFFPGVLRPIYRRFDECT
jgi:hypothetical protein